MSILEEAIYLLQCESLREYSDTTKGYIFELENCARFDTYDGLPINKVFICHSHAEAIIKIREYLLPKRDIIKDQLNYLRDKYAHLREQFKINIKEIIDDMVYDVNIRTHPSNDSQWIRVLDVK